MSDDETIWVVRYRSGPWFWPGSVFVRTADRETAIRIANEHRPGRVAPKKVRPLSARERMLVDSSAPMSSGARILDENN